MKQGIEYAWNLLVTCDPPDVVRRAAVTYSPDSGQYVVPMLGHEVIVDPVERTLVGSSQEAEFMLTKMAYFSRLSVLHYLLNARDIEPTGRLVKPEQLKSGLMYLQGSHLLPLDQTASRFARDPEGFFAQAAHFGGEHREYGDLAVEFRPFPRVSITLIVWQEDDEFPARSYLLLDETCELQLPADILWSVAMLCMLVMLRFRKDQIETR